MYHYCWFCHNIGACFSRVRPTPLTHPKLVAHSQPALDLLGLAPDQVHVYKGDNIHMYMYTFT